MPGLRQLRLGTRVRPPQLTPRLVPPVAYIAGVHHKREGVTRIECLAGDYIEEEQNHRRKAYTKRRQLRDGTLTDLQQCESQQRPSSRRLEPR